MGNKGISLSNFENLASAQPQECLENMGFYLRILGIWPRPSPRNAWKTKGVYLSSSGNQTSAPPQECLENKGILPSNSGNLASAQPQECLENKGISPSDSRKHRRLIEAQKCLGGRIPTFDFWQSVPTGRIWKPRAWKTPNTYSIHTEFRTTFFERHGF